MKFHLKDYLEI